MDGIKNQFGLSERTMNEIINYFKRNPYIEEVKIYGSRAKGNFRNGSDIDFAVRLKEGGRASIIKWDLYTLPTPYKFDVTDYKKLEQKSIDTDGILFYQK